MKVIISKDQDSYVTGVIVPAIEKPIEHVAILSIVELRAEYEKSALDLDEFIKLNPIGELKIRYNFDIVDKQDLPLFLSAHRYVNNAFVSDMEKAKELQVANLRQKRNIKLDKLDKLIMIAERDTSEALTALQQYRGKLLDAPSVFSTDIADVRSVDKLIQIDLEQYIKE